MTDLLSQLQDATEGSHVCWCRHCGRTMLYRPAKKSGANVIAEGNNRDCRASMEYGPLSEIIAIIKVHESKADYAEGGRYGPEAVAEARRLNKIAKL